MAFPPDQIQLLKTYEEALGLYKKRQFKEALEMFKEADKLEVVQEPADAVNPSRIYMDRCKEYLKNPPGDDWDGVFTMTTK